MGGSVQHVWVSLEEEKMNGTVWKERKGENEQRVWITGVCRFKNKETENLGTKEQNEKKTVVKMKNVCVCREFRWVNGYSLDKCINTHLLQNILILK